MDKWFFNKIEIYVNSFQNLISSIALIIKQIIKLLNENESYINKLSFNLSKFKNLQVALATSLSAFQGNFQDFFKIFQNINSKNSEYKNHCFRLNDLINLKCNLNGTDKMIKTLWIFLLKMVNF